MFFAYVSIFCVMFVSVLLVWIQYNQAVMYPMFSLTVYMNILKTLRHSNFNYNDCSFITGCWVASLKQFLNKLTCKLFSNVNILGFLSLMRKSDKMT